MEPLTVGQAAAMAGKSPSQISRMITRGTMSAVARNVHGHPLIDPAEVLRCYPDASLDRLRATHADAVEATEETDATVEIERLRSRLEAAETALDHERKAREDERKEASAERRELHALLRVAQETLPRLLADQRTAQTQRVSWWRKLLGD